MEIESPWLFELSNTGVNLADHKITHAGVLEFIAEEGHVHLPAWVREETRPYKWWKLCTDAFTPR